MKRTKKERILQLLKEMGVLRPRDLEEMGISGVYLNKLYAEGVLERPSRGLYTLADAEPSEHRTIVEACKLVPRGVVCLLSALRFHEITTQSPFEVWLAIGVKARLPKIDYPPLRIVRFSGDALPGLDVAIEALRDCLRQRKASVDELWEALFAGN